MKCISLFGTMTAGGTEWKTFWRVIMAEWIDSNKQDILEHSGFFYDLDRMIYFNTLKKKVFSFEEVSDRTVKWLKNKINEPNEGGDWKFYFGPKPSEDVIENLKKILERNN